MHALCTLTHRYGQYEQRSHNGLAVHHFFFDFPKTLKYMVRERERSESVSACGMYGFGSYYMNGIFFSCALFVASNSILVHVHILLCFFFRNFLLSTSNELSLFGGANEIAFQNELLVWPVTNNKLLYGPTGRRRAMGQSK